MKGSYVEVKKNNWIRAFGIEVILPDVVRDMGLESGEMKYKEGSETGEMEFTEKYNLKNIRD